MPKLPNEMTKKELQAELRDLQFRYADLNIMDVKHLQKIDMLKQEVEDLKSELKYAKGQLAEYHAVLVVQKETISALEKRLEVYRK